MEGYGAHADSPSIRLAEGVHRHKAPKVLTIKLAEGVQGHKAPTMLTIKLAEGLHGHKAPTVLTNKLAEGVHGHNAPVVLTSCRRPGRRCCLAAMAGDADRLRALLDGDFEEEEEGEAQAAGPNQAEGRDGIEQGGSGEVKEGQQQQVGANAPKKGGMTGGAASRAQTLYEFLHAPCPLAG
eukprot:1145686-Pelagomonas_calceolata.AAC.2